MRECQVSGSSVFWWMERSGILQNTGGRKVGRGLACRSGRDKVRATTSLEFSARTWE